MTRKYGDLQVLRNLLPDLPDSDAEQALLNVLTWVNETPLNAESRDSLFDAIADPFFTEYDWSE